MICPYKTFLPCCLFCSSILSSFSATAASYYKEKKKTCNLHILGFQYKLSKVKKFTIFFVHMTGKTMYVQYLNILHVNLYQFILLNVPSLSLSLSRSNNRFCVVTFFYDCHFFCDFKRLIL